MKPKSCECTYSPLLFPGSIPDCVFWQSIAIAERCASVAREAAGGDCVELLCSLAGKARSVAECIRSAEYGDEYVSGASAISESLLAASKLARSRDSFRLVPANSGLLLDITDCLLALDSAYRIGRFAVSFEKHVCIAVFNVAIGTFKSVFFASRDKTPEHVRSIVRDAFDSLAVSRAALCIYGRDFVFGD